MQALERVELAGYAKAYPHMLSGGEQQRVALARALAPQPGIMLMDEPFSNLDQRTRESIREETVAVLRDNRSTALVVTHDAVEAMTIADRILMMQAGRTLQVALFASGTRSRASPRPAWWRRLWQFTGAVAQGWRGRGRLSSVGDSLSALPAARGTSCPGTSSAFSRMIFHLAVPGLDQPLRLVAAPGSRPGCGAAVSFTVARGRVGFRRGDGRPGPIPAGPRSSRSRRGRCGGGSGAPA